MTNRFLIALAASLILAAYNVTVAQFTCTSTPTGEYEIFVEVLSSVSVRVTNLETGQVVLADGYIQATDNHYNPNPGSGNTCD